MKTLPTKKKAFIVEFSVPDSLNERINDVMLDEINIAQRKWDVHLSDEEIEKVFACSKEQLESKMSNIIRSNWSLDDEVMNIYVFDNFNNHEDENFFTMNEENKDFPFSDIWLHRGNDGWMVIPEETGKTIPPKDFYDKVVEEILTFSRTAVFYGVGSYV